MAGAPGPALHLPGLPGAQRRGRLLGSEDVAASLRHRRLTCQASLSGAMWFWENPFEYFSVPLHLLLGNRESSAWCPEGVNVLFAFPTPDSGLNVFKTHGVVKWVYFLLGCQPGPEYGTCEYLLDYIREKVIDVLHL